MAFQDGRTTSFTLNSKDLSAYADNTDWSDSSDLNETTTYGSDSKTFRYGLYGGTFTVSGMFDAGTNGPQETILSAKQGGSPVTFAITDDSNETVTGNCLVGSYSESRPVGDVIKWSADFTTSGDITYSVTS